MKTVYISILLLFLRVSLYAQNINIIKANKVDRIYLAENDFRIGKCTYFQINPKKGDKIKLHQYINSSVIEVVQNDSILRFCKDSIFGVYLLDGTIYRFINRTPWKLSDTAYNIYIYELKTTRTEYKISGPHRRRYDIPVTYYEFAYRNSREVHPLTLSNLEKYTMLDQKVLQLTIAKFP